MDDTIVAISTAQGVGAISIVRVSGKNSIEIVNKVFSKDILSVRSHTIHYGYIMEDGERVDEVLISIMRSPKTFTLEDVVEINCHGGISTTNKVLELLLFNGCRLAEPGEFTKRAFLNGRIDLTEAEGVMDLINSETDLSRKMALNQVGGMVSSKIRSLRDRLSGIISNIEVNIDYPEYEDIKEVTLIDISEHLDSLYGEILKILAESDNGEILKNGIRTAILGRPNVGKSSILNKFVGKDKAIVTSIPGTTRDTIEAKVLIDNIVLNLIDTAGIRDTSDEVESIGVNKSLGLIENAELILLVLNYNEVLTKDDLEIIDKIKDKPHLIIVNKIDLDKKIDDSLLTDPIFVSAMNDKNMDEIKKRILEMFNLDMIKSSDLTYLTGARSKAILRRILSRIKDVNTAIKNDIPIDMIEIDLKSIWNSLGDIIGESYDEELLDEIFSRFCVGK